MCFERGGLVAISSCLWLFFDELLSCVVSAVLTWFMSIISVLLGLVE